MVMKHVRKVAPQENGADTGIATTVSLTETLINNALALAIDTLDELAVKAQVRGGVHSAERFQEESARMQALLDKRSK